MGLIVKNDEQIQVGITPGLTAGSSSFTFDGTQFAQDVFKPDYRGFEIVVTKMQDDGGMMVKGTDYSWNYSTGYFNLLQSGDQFQDAAYYNVHFQPLAQPLVLDRYALINTSFFIRDINIPNLALTPNNTNVEIIERINSFIVKLEPECLEAILGYSLYTKLLNETSTRIDELIYGAEYTYNNTLRKYKGLVYNLDISLIANYIYFFIQRADVNRTTGVATTQSNSENGVTVSPQYKMTNAWNFFSSEVKLMSLFLWTKKDNAGNRVYPEFTECQYKETIRFSSPINEFGI